MENTVPVFSFFFAGAIFALIAGLGSDITGGGEATTLIAGWESCFFGVAGGVELDRVGRVRFKTGDSGSGMWVGSSSSTVEGD